MRIQFLTNRGNAFLCFLYLGFNGANAFGTVFQFKLNSGIGLLRMFVNVGGELIYRHIARGVILGIIGGIRGITNVGFLLRLYLAGGIWLSLEFLRCFCFLSGLLPLSRFIRRRRRRVEVIT